MTATPFTPAHQPPPEWVDRPERLAELLPLAHTRIGLDTEFIRERTFWPVLALVQIAFDGHLLLVDPCIPGMADALSQWLAAPHLLKVMHSPGEDMVALRHACSVVPTPMFDTQLAATYCGLGSGMGYAKLVETLCAVTLAKGETRTDWLRRPLSPAQLDYAADDVRYLFAMHDALTTRLDAIDQRAHFEADCAHVCAIEQHAAPDPWPHLSLRAAQHLDRDAQRRLLRLLRWRDARAHARDLPRSWVLSPEHAIELARLPQPDLPQVEALLASLPRAPANLGAAITQALSTPVGGEDPLPLVVDDRERDKAYVKALQNAIAERTTALGLPDGMLASRRALQMWLETGAWPASVSAWKRQALDAAVAGVPPPRTT